ncbi:MAG TPA: hypothetical protein VGN34_06235 [Ktedonobacteraceae bacterium]
MKNEDDQMHVSDLGMEGRLPLIAPAIPERFRPAYQAVQRLERHERYLAAIIFGSVARGDAIEHNYLIVLVIVNENTSCRNSNYPVIEGIKLNLAFLSLDQFHEKIWQEIEHGKRLHPLMITESMVVFDKTKTLHNMKERAQPLQPGKLSADKQQHLQHTCLIYNDRVESHLKEDPLSALLIMHEGLVTLLMSHYQVCQKWWVSSHRQFADLGRWDPALAHLVGDFVTAGEADTKFRYWSAILDYILQPLGGRQIIPSAKHCGCRMCQYDVSMLLEK